MGARNAASEESRAGCQVTELEGMFNNDVEEDAEMCFLLP